MTIDVATGIARILKQEGVGWVSTFPVCRVNNALGREGVPMLMMRDDRYAVAVADAFSRITAGSQGGSRIGVAPFQGGVNAAGMQYAYAGMAQAYEDGSPVLCITDGVPAGASGNSQYDVASAMKTVSKWFGYLDKPERTPGVMRRALPRPPGPGDPGHSECPGHIRRDRRPLPPGEGVEIGAGPRGCARSSRSAAGSA